MKNDIGKQQKIPEEIALMLYRNCQLDCGFCYTKGIEIDLPPSKLLNLYMNIIKSYHVVGHHPRIFIGGLGEPTLGENYAILEEIISSSPENNVILFSNQVEPEKTIDMLKRYSNIERVFSRIVNIHGGDILTEGMGRPTVSELITLYSKEGLLHKLEFEILLHSGNLNVKFPTSILEEAGIPFSYAGAVPLGESLKTGLYLDRDSLLAQTKKVPSSREFLGATNCIIIEEGLTLTGLNVSLCPGALIEEVYARYPERYAERRMEYKQDLNELREETSRLIDMKKGRGMSTGQMCIGRETLYLRNCVK